MAVGDSDDLATIPTGPVLPLGNIGAPGSGGLPLREVTRHARLWWVGAHGGAAESTLARLFSESAESHHSWPKSATGHDNADIPVVLTARTHLDGLRSAQEALTQWASGQVPGVRLLGLALVADAPGKLPKPLRDYARLVGGGAPRVWNVSWIEQWRTDPPGSPGNGSTSSEVRKLLKSVRALL
ncbi:DUF6668 family protein [Nocardiopsis sp. NPDC050513]|uniref:DUF6668 family protein n=1 Tax=Nocardiopsis sp. NPDC050513 TaxID=3364338 RepID=UPI0037B9533E